MKYSYIFGENKDDVVVVVVVVVVVIERLTAVIITGSYSDSFFFSSSCQASCFHLQVSSSLQPPLPNLFPASFTHPVPNPTVLFIIPNQR